MDEFYYVYGTNVCRDRMISDDDYVTERYDIGHGWQEDTANVLHRIIQDALHGYGNYSASEVSEISKEHALKIIELQESKKKYAIEEMIYGQGLKEYLQ